MGCAELEGGPLEDYHERRFVAAKRSDKSSNILQEGRFADAQE